MSQEHIYKVIFFNQGQIYEVFARQVSQGGLYGFVEVEGLLFGERSQVVIDPSEEQLKSEMQGVKRFYVPMHAVIRIDEVEKRGTARIVAQPEGGNVAAFPLSLYGPGGSDRKT